METIATNNIEIRSWCPDIEEKAMDQMKLISQLPFVKEICLMPDGHLGQNMCIGGVVATDNVVVPDFVGADIGCGMCAMKTNITVDDLTEDVSKKIFNQLQRDIPVGFNRNHERDISELRSTYKDNYNEIWMDIFSKQYSARKALETKYHPLKDRDEDYAFWIQLGTLGGGNHFLEIQKDEQGFIWIMIHSGSRNIGKLVGDFYNDMALSLNKKWYSDNGSTNIPFFPVETEEGECYLSWMEFALKFAFMNRKVMMDKTVIVFERIFGSDKFEILTDEIADELMINIHHNYASLENHHGKNVWVHRKGATKATSNTIGIIPGSMGTNSYIVNGKGNHFSLHSCSHGAGRNMGRKEFSRRMKDSYDDIQKSLDGVLHSKFGKFQYGKDKGLLDVSEAPAAYKDIDSVMENQKDLVDILVKLRPLICLKG